MNSPFLNINWTDLLNSCIVAFLTAFIAMIKPIIDAGGLPTGAALQNALYASLAAVLGAILQKLFTNSKREFLKKEPNT